MSLLKIYTEDKLEYQLDGYIDNNTILFNSKTVAFYYDIVATTGTAYLEQVNKDKLKLKEIETTIVDSFALSFTSTQAYLEEQTASEGLYRYVLEIDSVNYYSELFCVKSEILTEVNTMGSGMLKVYDADYSEFLLDGYLENYTMLFNTGNIVPFYFNTVLTVSTFSCELFKIDSEKLKLKEITEVKIKDVTLLEINNKLYLNEETQTKGIYRYKILVNSIPFYSELFKVCENGLVLHPTFDNTLIFFDSTLYTFDNE